MQRSGAMPRLPRMDSLADYLGRSRATLVFTGPGIVTDPEAVRASGLSRGRRPVRLLEFLNSEPARLDYWDTKLAVHDATQGAAPNAVHRAIRGLQDAGRLLGVVTLNVDGLHTASGIHPERLVELHGTQAAVDCLACGTRSDPGPHFEAFRATRIPPRCSCGGWLKVATMSFGQSPDTNAYSRAERVAGQCDLVVALGSALCIRPGSSIPLAAAHRGIPYVIVHRGFTEHDKDPAVSLKLEGDTAELFVPAVESVLAAR